MGQTSVHIWKARGHHRHGEYKVPALRAKTTRTRELKYGQVPTPRGMNDLHGKLLVRIEHPHKGPLTAMLTQSMLVRTANPLTELGVLT